MEKLNWMLITLIAIITYLIWQTNEKFTMTSNEIDTLKKLFASEAEKLNYENKVQTILDSFNKTQEVYKEKIAERLPGFKSAINKIIILNNLIDNLYFDLRMNEDKDTRNKYILAYLYLDELNKTKKIGDIDLNNEKLEELVKIAKEWAKK